MPAKQIEWCRIHAGIWNGVRCGKVVATVVRSVDTRKRQVYIGKCGATIVRTATAEEAKALLADE